MSRLQLPSNIAAAGSGKTSAPLEPDEILEPDNLDHDDNVRPAALRISHLAVFALRALAAEEGNAAEALRDAIDSYSGSFAEWPAFVREVFGAMYDPTAVAPAVDPAPWASAALRTARAAEDWDKLCAAAQQSRDAAAVATATIVHAIAGALGLKKGAASGEDTIDPRDANEEETDPAIIHAAHRKRVAADASFIRKGIAAVGVAVGNAAKQASGAVVTLNALVGFGFSREGKGSLAKVAPEVLSKIQVNPKMLRILLEAGRIHDANHGAPGVGEGHVDVVGTRPTGELSHTTLGYRARLVSPGLVGAIAAIDLLEHRADGYDMRDAKPKERGDVAIVVDRSGSMMGDPIIKARALALATMLAGLDDGRRVVVATFAGEGDANARIVVKGDVIAVAEAIDMLCGCAGGGTDVDGALALVAGVMRAGRDIMREPDVLLITDGEFDPVDDGVMRQLGDARLMAVLIGNDVGDDEHPEFTRLWRVDDITDDVNAGVITTIREVQK